MYSGCFPSSRRINIALSFPSPSEPAEEPWKKNPAPARPRPRKPQRQRGGSTRPPPPLSGGSSASNIRVRRRCQFLNRAICSARFVEGVRPRRNFWLDPEILMGSRNIDGGGERVLSRARRPSVDGICSPTSPTCPVPQGLVHPHLTHGGAPQILGCRSRFLGWCLQHGAAWGRGECSKSSALVW